MNPWYGFDLDGTLATYDGWKGPHHIGEPIPTTIARLKERLRLGQEVRIFTARVAPPDPILSSEQFARRSEEVKIAYYEIKKWCLKYIGKVLPITYQKDFGMVNLEDDRCTQLEPNTGRLATEVSYLKGFGDGMLAAQNTEQLHHDFEEAVRIAD
jgi:hypothetical protein